MGECVRFTNALPPLRNKPLPPTSRAVWRALVPRRRASNTCVRRTSEKVVDVLQNYPLPVYRCAVKRYAAHCYVLTSLAKS